MESFFLKLRDWFWTYPDKLFFGRKSAFNDFKRNYNSNIPYSHFAMTLITMFLIMVVISFDLKLFVSAASDELIEGTVLGVDAEGNAQTTLNKISPLINSGTELEKDLNNLIYEGLIKVDQKGNPQEVLAGYIEVDKGKVYRFKLKDNLFWQDGNPITADDVIATFHLLQELESNAATSTIFSRAAVKMDVKKIAEDNKSFEFFVKANNVIPGFFEAISFKILPAHLLGDVTVDNVATSDPFINRNPVGSGAYRLLSVSPDTIELGYNDYYRGGKPAITKIKFKIFADEDSAVDALMSGQIHALTSLSITSLQKLHRVEFVDVLASNILYNQYWGLYFNLDDRAEAKELYPESLRDVKVRRAVASAIDKQKLIQSILGYGREAKGPIPEISFVYANEEKYRYNIEQAKKLLDEAGWLLSPGSEFRTKGPNTLEFNLFYLNSVDREKMAESIKADLAKVGVKINLQSSDLKNLREAQVISHQYDLLLYGVQTFIDPDRYELFHSSQIEFPGLNIASYKSTRTRAQGAEGTIVRIPIVDDDLDTGRRVIEDSIRIKNYHEFQEIIAEDVPVVFLYHPQEIYVVNKRVKGVKLDSLNALEDRFLNITEWTISLN